MANTIKTKILTRNDTTANWENVKSTVILGKGEMAVEWSGESNNIPKIKIGDGVSTWENLGYQFDDKVTSEIESASDSVYIVDSVSSDKNDTEAIAEKVTADGKTAKKGDMAIVKRTIVSTDAGEKISYTAYFFNGETWVAMDGNYSADNVYLADNITMAGNYSQVGNLTKTASGTGVFETKGKSLAAVLQSIFTKSIPATIKSNPSVSLSGTSGTFEFGTTINPSYTATFNDGSFTNNGTGTVAAGCALESCTISDGTTNKTGTSATFDSFVLSESKSSYSVKATVSHTASTVTPKDNLGSDTNISIAANKTLSSNTLSVTGYRRGYFIGNVSSKAISSEADITSELVRNLSMKKNGNYGAETINLTVTAGTKTIIVACPATKTGLIDVLNTTVNANMTSSFTKAQNIKIAGADGDATSAYAIEYNVWYFTPAEAYSGNANLQIKLG